MTKQPTILADTIQVLKDMSSEVDKLKAECSLLIEEFRELTREQNDPREENTSLISNIENLNGQYQQTQDFVLKIFAGLKRSQVSLWFRHWP